ncbi:alpha-ketoglutarate-dependent dioxygenase AlkB [Mucilaginibacter sp.]|jgi:alkylated DNA repair dioxygenase AlkB|uniref:alpha-ketoglutarate-dependent dioxygenase AlkB family protein n=1 Tax=Mucilaginibacter sp. TaxID=1882438 RepID=UPI00260A93C6|nr:alpha-ketoglutarate-dependent dioxygenase AlkB [Mucilaginibacter sp.]MDB4926623.1 Alkylated repair dioxygenase AlkB [Mucilaginibacter sp.]
MEQLCFFPEAGQTKGLPKAMLEYRSALFGPEESDFLMAKFVRESPWKQRTQKMWDKEVLTPRLTAWYGERLEEEPIPWTPELLMIKEKVEPLCGVSFNSVLLNYYRDGNDSVAWHSDKENVLGKRPVIASVTFGQVRSFDIRRKTDHKEIYSVRLEHGSFLLMKAGLQEAFEHRIAKSTRPMKPRINLTFRVVKHANS